MAPTGARRPYAVSEPVILARRRGLTRARAAHWPVRPTRVVCGMGAANFPNAFVKFASVANPPGPQLLYVR